MTEAQNPWKTLSSEHIYDNAWIQVSEHKVINPSGNRGIYGQVHFKNRACGVIPLDEDGSTWIVGQYRYTLNRYSWEIPMGGVAVDNDPLAGAQRELKEETGLTARSWSRLLEADLSNSVTDETGIVYVAKELSIGEPEFDDTERLDIRRLPFDDVVSMVHAGEMTDLLSIAGILKLAASR